MAMHRWHVHFVAAFLALMSISVAAPEHGPDAKAESKSDAKDACKTGRAQYSAGEVLRALKTLGKCVEQQPRNREGWTVLANAALEAGRFPESADAFAKAEALKPGDEAFLTNYLSALDGAGRTAERIPVLRALLARKPADRATADMLLAAVEADGADKHPDEYLQALQAVADHPGAEAYQVEKLAGAYLARGDMSKAEAEYRGLLEKHPESAEAWAGLGASQAASDPQAASECYRKAAFYSNQAEQRTAYAAERQRLAKAAREGNAKVTPDEGHDVLAAVAAPAAPKPAQPKAVEAKTIEPKIAESKPALPAKPEEPKPATASAKPPEPKTAEAKPAPVVSASTPAPAPIAAKPSKPFDLKAFQDSVYKAELEKRLAAIHAKSKPAASAPASAAASTPTAAPAAAAGPSAAPVAVAPAASSIAPAPSSPNSSGPGGLLGALKSKPSNDADKAEKEKQEAARDAAAKENQEREARAKEAAEKDRQAKADAEKERQAKAEKAKQDSLAQAERIARVEKAKQDSIASAAEQQAKAEKAAKEKQDREARAKEAAEKERQAKVDKAKQDSIAQVQERIARAEKAKQDSIAQAQARAAKAEKAKQDSIAKVAEQKARIEKAKQDSIAKVEERKAKEEKERLAREAERKRIEEEKARKLKEEEDRREKLAKERNDRYYGALELYRQGRMDTAAVAFKAVLDDAPPAEAYYFAGRVSLAKSDWGKALERFNKAPQDKPDLDGLKGKALMGLGRDKEALKAFEAQYAKSKDDSLLDGLIMLKRKTGDEAGAIAYTEKAAEKRPGEAKYQEELATYYRKQNDAAKAAEHYGKLLAINPAHAEANYFLGMAAAAKGDHQTAAPWLEKAVAAKPDRADAWKALAQSDAALGRKDAAWEACKKAFALLPNDPELTAEKLALARESHPADLAEAYQDVLKLAPGDADAAMGLARLRFEEHDYVNAEKYFRIACKDSKDSHAWAQYGRSLLELKKTDEAATALQKALDLGEKDPVLRLDLARIRMDKGDLDWAEALLKEMAKKSPADPEPIYWQGVIALRRQQAAVAEEIFRKANRLKPEESRYAEALASLLRDKDEYKEAVAVLAKTDGKLAPSGRLLYADCLVEAGEPDKAAEVYSELYRREASASLMARRIDLLVRTGKPEQAVALANGSPFLDAVEVRFSLAKAQLSLAEAHVIKGDVDQAVDLMKKVVKTDEHKPEYHYYLGLGYFDQNRYGKALGEFTDALTYRVDYPEAQYRKGLCELKQDDPKEAENAFGELSQHAEPEWKARGLYGLALVFEAQGKPEAIQHHLERSISAAPTADAMAYLSRVYLRQSKAAEAEDWARKALALDPSSEGATVALADALAAAKKQGEAMQLAREGLKARPLSCGLLVQSAKLHLEAGKLDSTLAASNSAIRLCPEEPMAYYYAGVATHDSNRPKEAKQYFKSFRKYGGDKKLVPEN